MTSRSLVALLSAAVLGTMGYGWWAFGDVDEKTVTTDVIAKDVKDQRIPLDGAVDMLLVGVDSRTDAYGNPLPKDVLAMLNAGKNDGERNTDTMILVHIPVDGTRAIAISFPRDSWVEIAGGYGKHRLNSAFAYAYNNAREELANTAPDEKTLDEQAKVAGRKNLIETVQNLVGGSVTIDRYAEVNLLSFYDVTNAIGGVEVCLNAATQDKLSGANFPAGPQVVSGAQALAFVRQRHGLPNGDLDRIVRQQVFLGALANKVLSADMLTSPSKVRELISAVQRSVVLSDGWQLSTFASQMSGLNAGGIDFYTIPTLGNARIGGADVLRIDPAAVADFVTSLTKDDLPASPSDSAAPGTSATSAPTTEADRPALGTITVNVFNGSNTSRLASQVRDSLVEKGFLGGDIGDEQVRSSSVIQYAAGERSIAEYLGGELGGQFTYEENNSLEANHLTVVLGTNYEPASSATNGLRAQPSTPSVPPSSETKPAPQVNASGLNCVN
ncbi:LCP family protein [Actinophytocola sp.]|uniref:LCP family protein n=1 Tax=Actinophytocola sp. TaxID=1872138 RepID=UPI002ED3E25A